MALILSSTSVQGRQRLDQNLVANQSYILLFPNKGVGEVRYEGVWEVIRLNSTLGLYVQVLIVSLWVDAHFVSGTNITSTDNRFSWVWQRSGVEFELHSA